jgi:hypothetical protein
VLGAVALAVAGDAGAGGVSMFQASSWYDVTDYRLLDDDADAAIGDALADACSSAASECLGLVLRDSARYARAQVLFLRDIIQALCAVQCKRLLTCVSRMGSVT